MWGQRRVGGGALFGGQSLGSQAVMRGDCRIMAGAFRSFVGRNGLPDRVSGGAAVSVVVLRKGWRPAD